MNIIKQNPFRVLGLTCNASERELQKQIAIIKRYSEIGKSKSFACDIEILGGLNRDLDEIQHASNKIEQGHNRLFYSLFWFINHNQFDEIALSNLNGNNSDKAIEVWSKVLKNEITEKNFSSYHNLSTLYIALATNNGQIDKDKLQEGISLKCALMHSNSFQDLSELVAGDNISICSDELSRKFIDEIIELLTPYLDERLGISINGLISLFNTSPSSSQKYVTAKFTEVPVSNIESQIDKTVRKRKDNPADAEEYGKKLYISTQSQLVLLKDIMGSTSVQFQMIENKLANEILQCSIDFFNEFRDKDGDFDPGEDALKIAKYAESLGATGQTKNRISNNLAVIQEWVNDAPNRERQKIIEDDLDFITNKLKNFQGLSNSIKNAKSLVSSCRPKLANVEMVFGSQDEFYLQVSSAVASNALGMIIGVVNDAQNGLNQNQAKLLLLPGIISSAVSAMSSMESLDMNYETRERFNINKKTIKSINATVQSMSNSRASKSSGGCYIATMAYGDYDHPQVMILRKFRDEKLANSIFGRSFIHLYYAISPHLAKLLKNQKNMNELIRNLLDKFISRMK